MNNYLKNLNSQISYSQIDFKYNCVSLFSGGGGLDLGLAWAGFKSKVLCEIEKPLCETLERNFPDSLILDLDVTNVSKADILKGFQEGESVDVVAGGSPCQSFSILGQRGSLTDPRGQLVYEYIRIVKELKPKVFLFENVPGILTINKGKDWKELLQFFKEETGYDVHYKVLNSADYGVPQQRKRVIVLGFRNDILLTPSLNIFPKPIYAQLDASPSLKLEESNENSDKLKNWYPAKYALENLEQAKNHRKRVHGDRVRNRYLSVAQGSRDSVDRTDRIDAEKPSGTVLVGSKAGGGRPFIHPYEPRHITIREAARLQSFPDSFEFFSSETWQYRAVGNAVPPLLAKAIGESIKAILDQN